jgi:6-phosphogluconolactonase
MTNIILIVSNIMLLMFSLLMGGSNEKKTSATRKFTATGSEGISVYDFNVTEGTLSFLLKENAGPSPSYFCISEKRKLIYAANEVTRFNGKRGGAITTLKYDKDFTKIVKMNEISTLNGSPCFISVSHDNNFLFLANYTGSSVTIVKLDKDGIPERICDSISFKSSGKKVSHPHMILTDPAGEKIYLTDLGLDRIMIYTQDKITGKLLPVIENGISLPEGTGPRHFVFNSDGSKMYVIGELKSTVTVFNVNKTDGLVLLQTISTLSESYKGPNSAADLHLGKTGEFLYGSNHGENSIVTFRIGKDGLLTLAGQTSCGGTWPRNFTLDPSGKYLLVGNQRSGSISVFGIDKDSGLPSKAIQEVTIASPACLKFPD